MLTIIKYLAPSSDDEEIDESPYGEIVGAERVPQIGEPVTFTDEAGCEVGGVVEAIKDCGVDDDPYLELHPEPGGPAHVYEIMVRPNAANL